MKPKFLLRSLLSISLLILSSCGGAGGPGPRTWIDAPLDGDVLPLGAVIVRSHASSPGGTASAALYVNGAQVRVDNATDPASPLIEFTQVFEPPAAGLYTLQIVATDTEGNEGRSNIVTITIGSVGESPATETSDMTSTPTSTSSTPANTDTPVPPVSNVPAFTFGKNANCRLGPSTAYEVKTSFLAGQTAQIDGRNQSGDLWWYVLIAGTNDHCWVADSTGSATGPVGNVAFVAAPPPPVATNTDTPEPPPPPQQVASPGNFSVTDKSCSSSGYVLRLTWGDVNGEDGYRVYRDNQLIATLPANTTIYDDAAPDFKSHSYYVQAFNAVNSANSQSQSSIGCVF